MSLQAPSMKSASSPTYMRCAPFSISSSSSLKEIEIEGLFSKVDLEKPKFFNLQVEMNRKEENLEKNFVEE